MAKLADVIDGLLSGRYAHARAAQREFKHLAATAANERNARFYAAANPGTDRPYPNTMSSPEDYKQSFERIVLIRAARQMEEDHPFLDDILEQYETYVVGSMRYVPSTSNKDADKKIRSFLEWKFDHADYSGRLDLTDMAKLAVRSKQRDGECGAIMVDTGNDVKLRWVSADCIGNPLIGGNISETNFNGITISAETGEPVTYDIWRRLAHLNSYRYDVSIPAGSFLHYYNPFRFEQYHGVTVFKNVIDTVFDVKQIIDYCKTNMKFRASQLPYVTNEQGRPRGTGYQKNTSQTVGTEPKPMTVSVDGVSQTYLKTGEAIVEFPGDFPNQQFLPAYSELMRLIAMGCKLPPEFCFKSDAGGVLTRFHINKAERVFEAEKRRLSRLLRIYKNRVIQKGIETGELDLSEFGDLSTSLKRFSGTWYMGRSVSVDYGREVDADLKLIEAGLMNPEEHMADNNRDPEEVREGIRRHTVGVFEDADAVADETGWRPEETLPYISKRFPNAPSAASNALPVASETTPDNASTS
jgi:capsid protein